MPALSSRGGLSANGFGVNSGVVSAGGPYWFAYFTPIAASTGPYTLPNSSGGLYVAGTSYAESPYTGLVPFFTSLNANGTPQFRKILADTSNISVPGFAAAADTSGYVYIHGYYVTSPYKTFLAKYAPDGVLQWQQQYSASGVSLATDNNTAIAISPQNSIYLTGMDDYTFGSTYPQIIKLNTSGAIQWQYKFPDVSTNDSSESYVAADPADNVYLTYPINAPSGSDGTLVVKLNSSGTIQWQRLLYDAGFSSSNVGIGPAGIAADASNVYVVSFYRTGSGTYSYQYLIAKYNSSGTLQWQRLYNPGNGIPSGIAVDASGNVYVTGNRTVIGFPLPFIVLKYNSSGTLQWQRSIDYASVNGDGAFPSNIAVDSYNSMYISANANGVAGTRTNALVAKLPTDGSKTGTYTLTGSALYGTYTITYAAASGSSSTSTFTDAAGSVSTSALSASASTASLVQQNQTSNLGNNTVAL